MKDIGTKSIRTDRLYLRKFDISDAEDMYNNWASDDNLFDYVSWIL